MEILWSILIGIMVAVGSSLTMDRHILRVIFGIIVLSNAINLALFVGGRLTKGQPALIPEGKLLPEEIYANPVPQALILTAIVIGFGLLIFMLALAWRMYKKYNSADLDLLNARTESEEA